MVTVMISEFPVGMVESTYTVLSHAKHRLYR